jgi:hypothetical protein
MSDGILPRSVAVKLGVAVSETLGELRISESNIHGNFLLPPHLPEWRLRVI